MISASGVQKLLNRSGLGRRRQRVAALAQLTAATTGLVTEPALEGPFGFCHSIFFDRSLRYDVAIDATTGQEHAVASITLTNRAPTTGQPPIVIASPSSAVPTGANRSIISFYTYLQLDHATVPAQPFRLTAQTERGLNLYTTALTISVRGDRPATP